MAPLDLAPKGVLPDEVFWDARRAPLARGKSSRSSNDDFSFAGPALPRDPTLDEPDMRSNDLLHRDEHTAIGMHNVYTEMAREAGVPMLPRNPSTVYMPDWAIEACYVLAPDMRGGRERHEKSELYAHIVELLRGGEDGPGHIQLQAELAAQALGLRSAP